MKVVYLCALILCWLFTGALFLAGAQAPSPVVPVLDDLDKAWLQTVQIAQKRANDACQGLEAVQEFNTLRQQTQTKVEARHPGFMVDWAKFALMAKPAKAGP